MQIGHIGNVDSVDDAVNCFLTTEIHALELGNYLIEKKENYVEEFKHAKKIKLSIPKHIVLSATNEGNSQNDRREKRILKDYIHGKEISVSQAFFVRFMSMNNKHTSVCDIFHSTERGDTGDNSLLDEILTLWSERYLEISAA